MAELGKIIAEFAYERGMYAGVCRAERYADLLPGLLCKSVPLAGFCEQDAEKRVNPFLFLPGASSILLFCLPYGKEFVFCEDGALRGAISVGAVGRDYHLVLTEALSDLAGRLSLAVSFSYRIFVDTGPFVERDLAVRCGLGFIGKNQAFISYEAGSWVFLGGMVTNLPLSMFVDQNQDAGGAFPSVLSDKRLGCGGCTRCMDACPGRALTEGGGFRPSRCISYLTQKKGRLTEEEMQMIGKQLYGCDICQAVCPQNGKVYREPFFDRDAAAPLLPAFLQLSNKAFQKVYGHTAAGWRGKGILGRNALCALGNYKREDAEALLRRYQEDERPLYRETARTALSISRR